MPAALRVLLVEDNPVNQQVTAAMLRKRGHTVDLVENGEEAVAAAHTTRYDVVVMDIQMPLMDGFEATNRIRDQEGNADVPIIAMTAHANREECLSRGMNDYLPKPFLPDELFRAVEREDGAARGATAPRTTALSTPVNVAAFRESLREAGVEDVLDSLLETFLSDAPGRMNDLEGAVASGDGGQIDTAAHAYKSAAGTVRAERLAELLRQTEAAGHQGAVAEATELVRRVREEHDAVIEYLENSPR